MPFLQALLAIPGLGNLLQGLLGLAKDGLIYWKGRHDATVRDELRDAKAQSAHSDRERQDEQERARLELWTARDNPAAVRERLRAYRASVLRGQRPRV